MGIFEQLLAEARAIDAIMLEYDVSDRDTVQAMQELERGVKALASGIKGGPWEAERSRVKRAARIMLNKSAKIPQQLERLVSRISGNTQETRQLQKHARQIREARNATQNALRETERRSSVIFNGTALSPGTSAYPLVLLHPGGTSEQSYPPAADFVITGTEGAQVSLAIEHVATIPFGGHYHDVGREPEFTGTFSTDLISARATSGSDPALEFEIPHSGRSVTVNYQATDFCSRFRITLVMQGFGKCDFPLEVKFAETMEDLSAVDHPYIETYTRDGAHPDSHWGREKLVTAITDLADAFGRELEAGRFGEVTDDQRKLWVNDLSLPWGGHIESHGNHKWGQNVDINHWRMNKKQISWLHKNLKEYFDYVLFHGKILHWHCSVHISL
ncbi:MAG: hypothetical protein FVQ81_08200 [Candidatus Glassbacteria bacterium]|nr:hypothetical protein [Candidatus Glassbacteria bacterium]